MVNVIKLGFLGLNAVKTKELRHLYADVIGLPVSTDTGKDVYLACGTESYAISLHRSRTPGSRHIGFQVAGEGKLDDVVKDLKAQGAKASLKSDLFPGIKSCVQTEDPDGHTIYLYRQSKPVKGPLLLDGVAPDKLGHIAFFVENAKKHTEFYTNVLGFRVSDWMEDFFVFLRCSADHHTMNFINHKSRRDMFHVAFELRDFAAMGRGIDVMAMNGFALEWGVGRHGIGHNLFSYFRDADRNVVELFAELDRMSDETLGYFDPRPYHQDTPQRPKVWKRNPTAANIWGIMPPHGFED